MTGAAFREWLAAFGDVTVLVIAYFIWTIKRNHLPHIYDRLVDLDKAVAFNKGQLTRMPNTDIDSQIGPSS